MISSDTDDSVSLLSHEARDAIVARCVAWALAGIVREFPSQLPMVWTAPRTLTRPRDVTPVFFGCYDWHSAVHNHWLLVRACRLFPTASWAGSARNLLEQQFAPDKLAAEVEFLAAPERAGFERPYGLAWLLRLTAELRNWPDPVAARWLDGLLSLEGMAVSRFEDWLPQLAVPYLGGEHQQTAFALGLLYDWACTAGRDDVVALVVSCGNRWNDHIDGLYSGIREPGPHDFLSPSLGSASLMGRVLSRTDFEAWLTERGFDRERVRHLYHPVVVSDYADGKLAHWAGLNFSRCWMLQEIAARLPQSAALRHDLLSLAIEHWAAGLPALERHEYAVTHWVGSFALYALSPPSIITEFLP